jgi:hypothetical protein
MDILGLGFHLPHLEGAKRDAKALGLDVPPTVLGSNSKREV